VRAFVALCGIWTSRSFAAAPLLLLLGIIIFTFLHGYFGQVFWVDLVFAAFFLSLVVPPPICSPIPLIVTGLALMYTVWMLGVYRADVDVWITVLSVMLASAIARAIISGWRALRSRIGAKIGLAPVVLVLTALLSAALWPFAATVQDHVFGTIHARAHLNPARFTDLGKPKFADFRLGLALSGGGYRAALIHAGVLDALEQLRLPVARMSTVSGGSIVGGWYTAGGRPEDFLTAVTAGDFRLRRQALQAPSVLGLSTRSDLLVNCLRRAGLNGPLLSEPAAGASPAMGAAPPLQLICTTDLLDGSSLGWGPRFLVRRALRRPDEGQFFNGSQPGPPQVLILPPSFSDTQPVASLIAASAAFPLVFNPVELIVNIPNEDAAKRYLLADGGITDNTGLHLLLDVHRVACLASRARRDWFEQPRRLSTTTEMMNKMRISVLPDWRLDYVISCDAGAAFAHKNDFGALAALNRAVDVISRNVRPGARLPSFLDPPICVLSAERELGLLLEMQRKPDTQFSPVTGPGTLKEWLEDLILLGAHRPSPKTYFRFPSGVARLILPHVPATSTSKWRLLAEQNRASLPDIYAAAISDPKRALESLIDRENHSSESGREQAENDIRGFLIGDAILCLQTYASSSTLEDDYDEETASALYRAGEYLVCRYSLNVIQQLQMIDGHRADGRRQWETMLKRVRTMAPEGTMTDAPSFEAFPETMGVLAPDMFEEVTLKVNRDKVDSDLKTAREAQAGLIALEVAGWFVEECNKVNGTCRYTEEKLAAKLLRDEGISPSATWLFLDRALARYGTAWCPKEVLDYVERMRQAYPAIAK
jgi:predicted acylesterase/phospholipase RssA